MLHSFAAVEAIANDSIDRLPQDAVVMIGKKDRTRDVLQEDMVRTLNLDEKFGLVVPMLDGGEPIKGRRPWERYLHLKAVRDDLVHVKDRGVNPDRGVRTAYDRLLLGDADTCAKDALDIVRNTFRCATASPMMGSVPVRRLDAVTPDLRPMCSPLMAPRST